MTDVKALTAALSTPFEPGEVKFKPQTVKGNRAMAVAYIDCRVIQDRLDEVLGAENWQDDYELVPEGSVICRLRLRFGGEWVTKMDVGSPSEQPDGGDRLKAAFSDALKRAAVKFGIGRYLYRLPMQWADFDPVKKAFTTTPSLPAVARPRPTKAPAEKPPVEKPAKAGIPVDGDELHRRLREYDTRLAGQKLCGPGKLLSHVAQAGVKAGYGDDITKWAGPAIDFAVDLVKRFEGSLKDNATAA